MTDPKRWLEEPRCALRIEQRLVRAGQDIAPPPGTEEAVWASLWPLLGPGSGGGPGPAGGTAGGAAGGTAGGAAGGTAGGAAGGTAGGAAGGTLVVGSSLPGSLAVGLKSLLLGAAVGVGSVLVVHGARVTTRLDPTPAVVGSQESRPVSPAAGHDERPMPRRKLPVPDPGRRVAGTEAPVVQSELEAARQPAPAGPRGVAVFPDVSSPATAPAEVRRRDQLREEALQLARAKNLLSEGQVRAALDLLGASSRRFPSGALAQEREALVVEALMRSGERELARRRAEAMLARYPTSPLAGRLRELTRAE